MNISFVKILFYIAVIGVVIVSLPFPVFTEHAPIWPIRPNIANWDRVNCTFGEVHGGGTHIHGAIDIDHDQGVDISASVVQPGKVVDEPFGSDPGTGVIVVHEYPPDSGRFERRTQYLHLEGNIPEVGDVFGTGDSIGVMGNHLHFVMEELIDGEWVRLNPLDEDNEWHLRYHQHLESRPDTYEPQINDILIEAKTGCTSSQDCPGDNGVASGFDVYTTAGGLVEFQAGATSYVRAHLADVSPASCNYTILGATWNGPLFHYADDKLVVYGNLGITARARDVAINSAPGHGDAFSSGCGLTVKRLNYRIDNELDDINDPIKYDLTFDQIRDNERDQVSEIFANATFDPNHIKYGNNDFLELRDNDNDTYLSPYPHVPIFSNNTSVQSNGIWFTKASADTHHVFRYTPDADHVAACNTSEEAKYPDDEYTLTFRAEDDYGRINRDLETGRDVNAKLKVIVDNFRPYVKDVKISSGTFPIYSSAWNWNTTTHALALRPNAVDEKADMGQPLHIAVKTSEPMKVTTDASGQPNGSMKIKLFARDPDDPSRIKVYLDWYDQDHPDQNTASRPRSANEEGTVWNFFVPHSQYTNLTGGFENYTQFVHITGTDLAETPLTEYDGSQASFDADNDEIPYRDPNDPHAWINPNTGFGNISGVDTVHRFQFSDVKSGVPFLATYDGSGFEQAQAIQVVYRVDNGIEYEDGSIVAGWSSSFGNDEEVWILRLSADGAIQWQKTYGTAEKERAYAIQQTFRYENGIKQEDGFIVACQQTSGSETTLVVFKLDMDGNIALNGESHPWEYRYDPMDSHEYATAISQAVTEVSGTLVNDGYIVAGYGVDTSGKQDALLLKLDDDGYLSWAKKIGRNGSNEPDKFTAVQQTDDKGYLATGWSRIESADAIWLWACKFQQNGDLAWTAHYKPDNSSYTSYGASIHSTSDGGSIVAGAISSSSNWQYMLLLKLSSMGDKIWSRTYQRTLTKTELYAIQQTTDDSYVATGRYNNHALMAKFTSIGGVDWVKTLQGQSAGDYGYAVQETSPDTGSIVTGRTNGDDIFVLKLDEEGCVGDCQPLSELGGFSQHLSVEQENPGISSTDVTPIPLPVALNANDTAVVPNYLCYFASPTVNVKQGWQTIADGGTYNFKPVPMNTSAPISFRIENLGTGTLVFYTPDPVTITNDQHQEFSLSWPAGPPPAGGIVPGESVDFTLTLTPTQTITEQTATVTIQRDDPDHPGQPLPVYSFTVQGNQQSTLTVTKTGTGGGTVSSPGITCGADCDKSYAEGTMVNLAATSDVDSVFTGWKVGNQPMGLGNLAIMANHTSVSVDAEFTRKKYLLAGRLAESNGNALAGIIMTVSDGAGTTTDANGFYSLVVDSGWTGTVTPEVDGYVLTFEGQQVENGQPYPDPVRNDILFQNYSASVKVAVAGQVLLAGGTGLADVLLDGCPAYVLTAADGTYTASVPSGWSGTVTPQKTGYTFAPSTFVHTNVTVDLSGQDAVGTSTDTYTMSGHVQTSSGEGIPGVIFTGFPDTTVTSSEGAYSTEVNSGWSGTITPQKDGYTFTPSTVPYSAVTGPLTQDYTGIGHHSLTVSTEGTGLGSVTSSPAGITCGTDCTETYAENTPITLSAAPDSGSTFTGWSGGGCSGTGTCLVILTEDTSVSAVFTEDIPQHTLTVISDGEGNGIVASSPDGILCGNDCTEPFDEGTDVTLGAMPQSDSTFSGWSGGGCSGTDSCAVTMTADTIVTATFTPVHTLIVEKAGSGTGTVVANGINCGPTCENSYDDGTGLVLKAIPDAGSSFTGWQVNGAPSGCLVVIDGPTTVTATFE